MLPSTNFACSILEYFVSFVITSLQIINEVYLIQCIILNTFFVEQKDI